MPLLNKHKWERDPPPKPEDFSHDPMVIYLDQTNEMFLDHGEFFKRVMHLNSTVWTCAQIRKSHLTFYEASKSESEAQKDLQYFLEFLELPILFIVHTYTNRGRFEDVVSDVYCILKDRFVTNEECSYSEKDKNFHVRIVASYTTHGGQIDENLEEGGDQQMMAEVKEPVVQAPEVYRYTVEILGIGIAEEEKYREDVTCEKLFRSKVFGARQKIRLFLKNSCHLAPDSDRYTIRDELLPKVTNMRWLDVMSGQQPICPQTLVQQRGRIPNVLKSGFVDGMERSGGDGGSEKEKRQKEEENDLNATNPSHIGAGMPLLNKHKWERDPPPKPEDFSHDPMVIYLDQTNEMFLDHGEFFKRVMHLNSTVWTCAQTRKSHLTFYEASKSESEAEKDLQDFPEFLELPILFVVHTYTNRGRFEDVVSNVYCILKDRFVTNEECSYSEKDKNFHVRIVASYTTHGGQIDENLEEGGDQQMMAEVKEPVVQAPEVYRYTVEILGIGIAEEEKYREDVTCEKLFRSKVFGAHQKIRLFLKNSCHLAPDSDRYTIRDELLPKVTNMRWLDVMSGQQPICPQTLVQQRGRIPNVLKSGFVDGMERSGGDGGSEKEKRQKEEENDLNATPCPQGRPSQTPDERFEVFPWNSLYNHFIFPERNQLDVLVEVQQLPIRQRVIFVINSQHENDLFEGRFDLIRHRVDEDAIFLTVFIHALRKHEIAEVDRPRFRLWRGLRMVNLNFNVFHNSFENEVFVLGVAPLMRFV